MRRWWTGIAVATLGALVPALAPAISAPAISAAAISAAARARVTPNLVLTGTLTIAWQGDPTRGCAAQGLCGVTGSLELVPMGGPATTRGAPSIELMDPYSAARVIEAPASGSTGAPCTDLAPVDFFLRVRRGSASDGELRATPDQSTSMQLPSAGRCAGPTVRDLLALALPARRLGAHGYDLSGRTTFSAGPFTVTAFSTLRAVARGPGLSLFGGSGSGHLVTPRGHPPRPRGPTLLEEHAEAVYRIESFGGALTTTFSGLAAPLCDPLGACGSTGSLSESFIPHGTVTFSGARFVKRRVGTGAALTDLGAGRLGINVNGTELAATLSEVLAWPNGSACADRSTQMASLIDFPGPDQGLTLVPGDPKTGPSIVDPLRTRCPGPSATDVLGIAQLASPLATATGFPSGLGDPGLTLTFGAQGPFVASDYAGERGGSVVMSLALEHASGGTSRIRAFTRRQTKP